MSLSGLLGSAAGRSAPVAFHRDGIHGFDDFRGRALALAEELRARGAGRWLLHCENSHTFAVGLFGLAASGSVAVLAPNRQPGTLARLGSDVRGALMDGAPGAFPGTQLDPCSVAPVTPGRVAPLDPSLPFLELYTSGTTGAGKCVPKALRHLESEVEVLEQRFGALLGPATRIFATASHQHLYGLLFRVLWPIAAGRPFLADAVLHAEELLPRLVESGDCALVSTPAHLRRMPGLERARHCMRATFSSGAPLDEAAADALRSALGEAPIEIFGSSETGGVAWRRQVPGPERLLETPLPGVEIATVPEGEPAAGQLVVDSPFVSVGSEVSPTRSRFTMGDRARILDDGRFELLGRADRVVKIGEKRLSLPEMESLLRADAQVEEVALLSLERGGEQRVAAAVVLSEAGRSRLAAAGRRALGGVLQEPLAAHWDRVLLPRVWRFVDSIPRDAQGKIPAAALRALFAPPAGPRVEEETLEEGRLLRRCSVPDDLAFLEGHFPGFPVVPGIAQLAWAVQAAGEAFGAPPAVRGLEALKFHRVLLPGQSFHLELLWRSDRRRFAFRIFDADQVFASGRCLLEEAR